MRLTIEEDRESIKRYRHIKPTLARGVGPCAAICPGTARTCTLGRGHRGPHVAHGMFNRVLAVWDTGTAIRSSRETEKRALEARARRGLRTSRQVGPLGALWNRLVGLGSSIPDLALLVLLLGFVGFAVRWALLIIFRAP